MKTRLAAEHIPSFRRAALMVALFLITLGLSACGDEDRSRPARSDSKPTAQPISPKAIQRCLEQNHIGTSKNVDRIAREAGIGALAAVFRRNYVNIVVERTASEASSTVRAYEGYTRDPKMRLEQTGAVVAAYAKTPTAQEKQIISRCVKGP
jgi:hypothetical protein